MSTWHVSHLNREELAQTLGDLEQAGWEIFQVLHAPRSGDYDTFYVLSRAG